MKTNVLCCYYKLFLQPPFLRRTSYDLFVLFRKTQTRILSYQRKQVVEFENQLMAIGLAGNRIVYSINKMEQLLDSLLVLLGLYYLLDFDYPHYYKAGLTVLHYFIFGDRSIPGNMLERFYMLCYNQAFLVNFMRSSKMWTKKMQFLWKSSF